MSARVVGYAPGIYDLFHIGHLNLLRHARQYCDYLIAGVLTDEMAQHGKGMIPTVPLEERLEIVENIRLVDEAVAEDLPEKLAMWEKLRFDVVIKGDDWKGTERGERLERDFAPFGVRVAYVPYTKRTSSSLLRQVIQQELDARA